MAVVGAVVAAAIVRVRADGLASLLENEIATALDSTGPHAHRRGSGRPRVDRGGRRVGRRVASRHGGGVGRRASLRVARCGLLCARPPDGSWGGRAAQPRRDSRSRGSRTGRVLVAHPPRHQGGARADGPLMANRSALHRATRGSPRLPRDDRRADPQFCGQKPGVDGGVAGRARRDDWLGSPQRPRVRLERLVARHRQRSARRGHPRGPPPRRRCCGRAPRWSLASVAAAGLAARWDVFPAVAATALGTLGMALGVASITSVLMPYRVPAPGESPFGADAGSIGASLVGQLVSSLGTGVVGALRRGSAGVRLRVGRRVVGAGHRVGSARGSGERVVGNVARRPVVRRSARAASWGRWARDRSGGRRDAGRLCSPRLPA